MAFPANENRVVAAEVCEASPDGRNSEAHRDQHHHGSAAPAAATQQQQRQHPLAKQSSLLFLTLDEFQSTVCEPGRSFGSMNIEELLANICDGGGGSSGLPGDCGFAADGVQLPPAPLCRQGSLSIPAPLCRKTVDEVWSDIQRDQQQELVQLPHQVDVPRRPTVGEMTLEDFLVKAGIVREDGYLPSCSSPLPLHQQLPLQNHQNGLPVDYSRVDCERLGYGPIVGHQNHATADDGVYRDCHHQSQREPLLGGGRDGDGGGRMGRGHVRVGSSPVSLDGFDGPRHVGRSNPGCKEWGGTRRGGGGGAKGKRRILDGPVQKVVERRQRRMMKNRESAARSRARKQAYTVELEKELNLLKEENARLQEQQQRSMARRQLLHKCMVEQSEVNLQRSAKMLRQCCSSVW